jgi:hypothetical protein
MLDAVIWQKITNFLSMEKVSSFTVSTRCHEVTFHIVYSLYRENLESHMIVIVFPTATDTP